jgi:hypothetical protein
MRERRRNREGRLFLSLLFEKIKGQSMVSSFSNDDEADWA